MNFKTTLILVLLLAVVGGYFYFVEYGNISGYEAHEQLAEQGAAPEGELLFDDLAGNADAITGFSIERGGKTVVVGRVDEHWYQTEPVRVKLQDYAPQNVVRRIADLRYLERVVPGGADTPTLEDMGLTEPRAVVTVTTGDGGFTLRLGKLTLGGQGYVQVEGEDGAYVVSATLFGALLDQSINDWRSKSLDVPDASGAVGITLDSSEGDPIDLHKVDGLWRFDSKMIQRVNGNAVADWLMSIGGLSINEFIADNPESLSLYGLDKPAMRLRIVEPGKDDGTTTQTLFIGGTDISGEHRCAAWTQGDAPIEVVFTVNAAVAEGLAKSHADLRDPKVIAADTIDVRGLHVQQDGKTTLNLLRDPQEGYSFGEPDPGFDADYSASQELVRSLCDLTSTDQEPVNDGMGEPVASVQMTLATSGDPYEFKVYNHENGRMVVSGGESVGYVVPAEALGTLLSDPLVLRKRTILEIDPGSIERVVLRRDDGMGYTFEPKAGDDAAAWTLVGHESFEAQAFNELLKSLDPLRVERWLSDAVSPSAGWAQLTIEPKGGAPVVIQADPATGSAVMSGEGSAFILPETFIDKLKAEYLKRVVLTVPIDSIESVRLASNANELTLSRDGMQYVSDVGEVDQPLAAGVFDALSALRAGRYVKPMTLSPEDISYTVQLTTDDGEMQTLLVVDNGGNSVTVTFDEPQGPEHAAWFTLSRAALDKLIGPLLQIESPVK